MSHTCVIESLYPEFSNQGGDNGNMMYLRAMLPDAQIIDTHFTDEPAFATQDVDMIYMGYMTESEQERVTERLRPYAARLRELADKGCVILFTGNAAEVMGTSITTNDGRTYDGLGLFDFTSKQDFSERTVEVYMGELATDEGDDPVRTTFEGEVLPVVGYKIQFTQMAGDNSQSHFCRNLVGFGLAHGDKFEGFRRNNMIATWLCGPLLPLNPLLTEYLVSKVLGEETPSAPFREEALAAYRGRVEEFKTPGISMPI